MSAESRAKTRDPASRQTGIGLLNGVGAYGIWGMLALYFGFLAPAGPVEIVSSRVIFSLIFCLLLVTILRKWRELTGALRSPRIVGILTVAAALIAVNWLAYVYAVTSRHTIEAALGYFINPLVSVLLGVVLLRERLRILQWVAIGIGAVAVLVITIAYGRPPWISLILAVSFGIYGLVKNRVGSRVSALPSLTIETMVLFPVALGVVLWLNLTHQATLFTEGPAHFWLLALSGVITAVPLLLFGAAARRLPLSTIGILQYIAPVLQFITAVAIFHEEMPLERWIGFGLVWFALIIFTVDAVRHLSRRRVVVDADGARAVG